MSFDEEYNALWDWLMEKSRPYLEAPYGTCIYKLGELNLQRQKDTAEFNRRLSALKEKYSNE